MIHEIQGVLGTCQTKINILLFAQQESLIVSNHGCNMEIHEWVLTASVTIRDWSFLG